MENLSKLKKKRQVLRGAATKLLRALEGEDLSREEVLVKLSSLERTEADLRIMDGQILDVLIDNDASEEECENEYDEASLRLEAIEKSKRRVRTNLEMGGRVDNPEWEEAAEQAEAEERAEVEEGAEADERAEAEERAEAADNRQAEEVGNTNEARADYNGQRKADMREFKLPKLDLQRFNLNPSNFISFWTQFERIDNNDKLDDTVKFLYLRMCLEGNAKMVVESYPNTAENYKKALGHLRERYGRDDLIINTLHRELLNLVRKKPPLFDLYDIISSKIRSLEIFGYSTDKAEIMIPLIEECLPVDILQIWARKGITSNRLHRLLEFIGKEAEIAERVKVLSFNENPPIATAAALVTLPDKQKSKPQKNDNSNKVECVFCSQPHYSQNCTTEMDGEKRRKIIADKRVCFKCLWKGHCRKDCRRQVVCRKCEKGHYAIMCTGTKKPTGSDSSTAEVKALVSCGQQSIGVKGRMQTVTCLVGNTKIRVLLDSASQRSYATQQLLDKIQPKIVGEEQLVHIVFGGKRSEPMQHFVYEVTLTSLDKSKGFSLCVLNQLEICGKVDKIEENLIQQMKKENMALDECDGPIDLLMGADVLGRFIVGMRVIREGLIAHETVLGSWCLLGTTSKESSSNVVCSLLTQFAPFWDLEALGIEKPNENLKPESDSRVIKEFENNIVFEAGKYNVTLPWRNDHPPLDTNKDAVLKRLNRVVEKMGNSELYGLYDEVFLNWEADGIIEQIDNNNEGYFLAHRPVVKKDKTTKVRPVFDASARGFNGISLNDCLSPGPNMIAGLLPLLTAFRANTIGVCADIKQAFLMVGLRDDSDKNMLKFIWQRNGELIHFRHRRVVFGLTCSPFLLNATIQFHLKKERGEFGELLAKSFYVDDCVCSLDCMEQAKRFKAFAIETMQQGNFELRQWILTGDTATQKILGLNWTATTDELNCIADLKIEGPLTKKGLLSLINKVFDPLGFLAAPLLKMKLLMQEVFREKINWSEELPKRIEEKVLQWLDDRKLVSEIKIPRCIEKKIMDVHVFTDASERGLGVCIFGRFERNNQVFLRLIAAKAKVAPMDSGFTIPRKELIAALLGSRLSASLKIELGNSKITYWTDSTIVLYWIKRGEWKQFVGNRVQEIRQLTDPEKWRFIPGSQNPADLVSRGCDLTEYMRTKWWEGPEWLKEHEENWPQTELVSTKLEMNLTAGSENVPDLSEFIRSHRYSTNVKIMAIVLQFIARLKKQDNLDFSERAEKKLIWMLQRNDMERLEKFNCFMDSEGLMRAKTKILSKNFEPEFRTPLVIPTSGLAEDLIRETHEQNHHAPVATTLGILREKFWIIKGRRLARKVVNRCVRCRRFKARPLQAPPVGLPNTRVDLGRPFEVSGCDLAGPLFVKKGTKVWIVLFTCAVYRAVHLEMVDSLSTEAFLLAFKRFTARRGNIRVMYSDNGTNFTGAWNLIEKTAVEKEKKVKWIFNPPSAPWWGGFYERLVGLLKDLLRATLGRALLSSIELYTVLVEIEAVINTRPLTQISNQVEELSPLTPNMFLMDRNANDNTMEFDLDKIQETQLINRMKYVTTVKLGLKDRFKREYLGLLLLKKGKQVCRAVRLGEIVLIGSDEKKRIDWVLGRVVKVFPSEKDGEIRVVQLRTKTGLLLRPIQRLYPLEVDTEIPERVEVPENSDIISGPEPDGPSKQPLVTRSGRVVKKPNVLNL